MLYGDQARVQAKNKDAKADMVYKHVIIGAGVTARSCLKTLNELDSSELPAGYDGKVWVMAGWKLLFCIYTDGNQLIPVQLVA